MNHTDSIRWFQQEFKRHRVSIHAAHVAFFILVSFFPFLIFLISLLKFTPLTIDDIILFCGQFLPASLQDSINPLIHETYAQGNLTIVSLTAVLTLFAGSKGFFSIMEELDNINQVRNRHHVFIRRLQAIVHTAVFSVIVIASLLLLVYGNHMMRLISAFLPFSHRVDSSFILFRFLILFVLLTLYFLYLFRVVSRHESTIRSELPGAVYSALMWVIFSFLYSIYADYQTSYSHIYGSLIHTVLLMLWLYLCINIIFMGSLLNKFYRTHKHLHLWHSIQRNLLSLRKLLKNNKPKSH